MRIFFTGLFYLIFFLPAQLYAQGREKISVNNGWQFVLNDDPSAPSALSNIKWQQINIPHTWNAEDIIDDTVGYHQGIGWYKKSLFIPASYSSKHLELFFEGVCTKAEVFINGRKAGDHNGGFTGFRIDLDNKVSFGKTNEILVKADNGKYLRDSIPPYSGDFNLMGGIYRDVWLIATNKIHFSGDFGSNGILFRTTELNENKAAYSINFSFTDVNTFWNGTFSYQLLHNDVLVKSESKKLKDNKSVLTEVNSSIEHPRLWSPENPQLYTLVVQLRNEKEELLDEISQQVGFKWIGLNEKQEFSLNGKPFKLKGASRHQDYKNTGWALTDAMHVRDIELMKEMGCNFIRIAHYPQDPVIYEACDRLGLIAWSEIPVVDKVVDNPVFFKNSEVMMQEMILQNYNHPCVAIWGYHNEVRNLDDATIRHAKMLDGIAKKLDNQRLTAMAFESNVDAPYFKSSLLTKILSIADINGYNVYQGWYRGKHENIGSFLDTLHAYNPQKPIMLSEYGAGSIVNMHTYKPTLFDFSEEYQCDFHESYVLAGSAKPWMIGFAIWNFIDFQRDGREDVVPNINKKGMVTTDRQPKDVYYYYKSQWSKKPFVYIAGKHWLNRIGLRNNKTDQVIISLTVYSNQKKLMLYQDGIELGYIESGNGKFKWDVNVSDGENRFVCQTLDGIYSDVIKINYSLIDTTTFSANANWYQLNFNTGQSRTYFTDTKSDEQWIPDKPYTKGTWGYVGGKIWNTWPSSAWNGIREGIHKPIRNTDNEPLFQTFVEGLISWKADLPLGKYRVTILLSEPFTHSQRKDTGRVFNIKLNGELWMQELNLEKEFGLQTAVSLDKIVDISKGEALNIEFESSSGKTILNGVSIRKL